MFVLAPARRWLTHRWRTLEPCFPRLGRAGAVAIVTAICAPVLVMIVGFVVDFSYASYINQCLARATDAATLGSVSQTAATAGGGYGNLTFLQNIGVKYFNANTAQLSLTGVNFALSVTSDGNGGVTAKGSYSYSVPTFFAGVLGINNIPVAGNANTSAHPAVYANYYILIDASQSMGVASTQADMTRLFNQVISSGNQSGGETGCVFGCHVTTGNQTKTNEYVAHTIAVPPIQLRIDAAVVAVKSIISQAQLVAGSTQNLKFALYTIQEPPSGTPPYPTNLLQITSPASAPLVYTPPSSNYASLQTAASNIDLGNNNSSGRGDSDFPNELGSFATLLTTLGVLTNGSGASATSPLNYFIIVTDGLTDVYNATNAFPNCYYNHCTSVLDYTQCTPLKAKGTVAVLYTTYLQIWLNNIPNGTLEGNYSTFVSPVASQIRPALQSCATSSNFFFEASYGPDIVSAMETLFLSTLPSSARITQ